jgi:hypothetical protein
VGGVCGTHREMRCAYRLQFDKLKRRDQLGDLSLDWMIILKCILDRL